MATITVHQLLAHAIDTADRRNVLVLTDNDRSILYEHMKTLPEVGGDTELRKAAMNLVNKLGALTWRDRDIGFKEWKAVADLLSVA